MTFSGSFAFILKFSLSIKNGYIVFIQNKNEIVSMNFSHMEGYFLAYKEIKGWFSYELGFYVALNFSFSLIANMDTPFLCQKYHLANYCARYISY